MDWVRHDRVTSVIGEVLAWVCNHLGQCARYHHLLSSLIVKVLTEWLQKHEYLN
jgi:hypothetical protein